MNRSIKRRRFCWYLLFLCLFTGIFASKSVQASVNAEKFSLEVLDGRLSITAENIPLKVVLAKLHESAGLEYEIPKNSLDISVSVSFRGLSLERGIQATLRGLNYACVIDGDELTKVIILPGTDTTQENLSRKTELNEKTPLEELSPAVRPPTAEDLVAAMNAGEIELPSEIADFLKNMSGASASEAKEMASQLRITPVERPGDEPARAPELSPEDIQSILEGINEGL